MASYRAVPVALYLGVHSRSLKCVGQCFESLGEKLRTLHEFGIGPCRKLDFAAIDNLVGKQEGRKQQLARLGQGSKPGQCLATLGIDQ